MQARPVYFALLVTALTAVAVGQTPQVVVLRNGNVLEGQVDRLGNVVLVVTETSEIRLPAGDIERVAATLHDAYVARQHEVRLGVVVDRVRLASWCIRHELWAEAGAELAAAREISPRHPDIAYVERRLEVAARAAMRATQQQQQQAKVDEVPAESRDAELAELDALAMSLPPGALEAFARQVQPILVNSCAAGGCHASDDPREFRLNRDLVRGVATRESTLRNLEAVWNHIDHTTPEHSPLLLQPTVPHGGLPRPVFGRNRAKVQEALVAWVRQSTGTNSEPTPTEGVQLAQHEQVMASTPSNEPRDPSVTQQEQHFWDDPAAMGLEASDPLPAPTPQVRYGAAAKNFKPRDEFDPELFNRQMKRDSADTSATE